MNHEFAAVVALTRCEGLDLSLGMKQDAFYIELAVEEAFYTNK